MTVINGLETTPSQTFSHTLPDGVIFFTLIYRPMIQMWFIDIEYNDIKIYGLRVCHAFNLLYQWYRLLPFGLYVEKIEGVEPILIDDFSFGRFVLNILDQDEVEQIIQENQRQKSFL